MYMYESNVTHVLQNDVTVYNDKDLCRPERKYKKITNNDD